MHHWNFIIFYYAFLRFLMVFLCLYQFIMLWKGNMPLSTWHIPAILASCWHELCMEIYHFWPFFFPFPTLGFSTKMIISFLPWKTFLTIGLHFEVLLRVPSFWDQSTSYFAEIFYLGSWPTLWNLKPIFILFPLQQSHFHNGKLIVFFCRCYPCTILTAEIKKCRGWVFCLLHQSM